MLNNATGFKKTYLATGFTDLRRGIEGLACIPISSAYAGIFNRSTQTNN